MTNRISDHLTADDRAFLKAINFTPPRVFKPQPNSPGAIFGELMSIAFPGIYDHVIDPLEDPPGE